MHPYRAAVVHDLGAVLQLGFLAETGGRYVPWRGSFSGGQDARGDEEGVGSAGGCFSVHAAGGCAGAVAGDGDDEGAGAASGSW